MYVGQSAKQRLKQFMKERPTGSDESVSVTSFSDIPEKPLADFVSKHELPLNQILPYLSFLIVYSFAGKQFPNCSVMFADIYGFSAWSSEREPEQIFVLLQAVCQAFDKLARRRRVFTVRFALSLTFLLPNCC